MAKGAASKQDITNKILETFPGSFVYNSGKEIRIPMIEDGAQVQIKVALTCAKTNVEAGEDTAVPTANTAIVDTPEITEQEKKDTQILLQSLGF